MKGEIVLSQARDVEAWLASLASEGLVVKESSASDGQKGKVYRWSIQMVHRLCRYWVEVTVHQKSVSFASMLYKASSGTGISKDLYRCALSLNSSLNSAHIAYQDNSLILIHSYLIEDSTEDRFYRDLRNFHESHEFVYGRIFRDAKELM